MSIRTADIYYHYYIYNIVLHKFYVICTQVDVILGIKISPLPKIMKIGGIFIRIPPPDNSNSCKNWDTCLENRES